MSDDVKKIGLIVLIVVVVAIAVWSGMRSFKSTQEGGETTRAQEYKEKITAGYKKSGGTGGGSGMRPGMAPMGHPGGSSTAPAGTSGP